MTKSTKGMKYRHEYPTPEWAKRIYNANIELNEHEKERTRYWQHFLGNNLQIEIGNLVFVPELGYAPIPEWGYEILISDRRQPHICETICCTHQPEEKRRAISSYIFAYEDSGKWPE